MFISLLSDYFARKKVKIIVYVDTNFSKEKSSLDVHFVLHVNQITIANFIVNSSI